MLMSAAVSLFLLTFVHAVIPGPAIIFVSGIAARFSFLAAGSVILGILAATGVLLALAMGMTQGMLSLGQEAFEFARWAGVIVLAVLAWMLWPRQQADQAEVTQKEGVVGHFVTGAALAISQPLNLIFMLAIVPQFIGTTGLDSATIVQLSGAVMLGMGLAMCLGAAFGSALRSWVGQMQGLFSKITSMALVVFAGLFAAANVGAFDMAIEISAATDLLAAG